MRELPDDIIKFDIDR